jgi:hypothetical protein
MRIHALQARFSELFLAMSKDPKKLVSEIAHHLGKYETQLLLTGEGLSFSIAEKLTANRYKPEVGQLVRQAILKAYEVYKKAAS